MGVFSFLARTLLYFIPYIVGELKLLISRSFKRKNTYEK